MRIIPYYSTAVCNSYPYLTNGKIGIVSLEACSKTTLNCEWGRLGNHPRGSHHNNYLIIQMPPDIFSTRIRWVANLQCSSK